MYLIYSIIALLLFAYIIFIGSAFTKLFKLPAHSGATYVVIGILVTSTIQWLIAMPLQFLHLSWSVYYHIMLIQVIISIVFALIVHWRLPRQIKWRSYFNNHWFVWLMTGLSSLISWLDTLPYNLYNYYDDGFYLSRIGTQINVNKLANYDNYTGLFSDLTLDRVLTTYEIKHSFWLALFHVDLMPFVRISCVILAYLLIYHILVWCIVQLAILPRYWVQFVLSSLCIYLVSAAYLGYIMFFRSWDNWQFISASYFGGNFVRILALPLFIGFAYYSRQIRSLLINSLFYIMLCITLMSYSSMSVSYIIIGSLSIYLINHRYFKKIKLSTIALVLLSTLFLTNTLLGLPRLINHPYYFNDVYIEYVKTFLRIYTISLLILLLLGYYYLPSTMKIKLKNLVVSLTAVIITSVSYILVPFMLFIASGYMFVAARIGTSFQILLVLFVMIIWLYHAINYRKAKYLVLGQCALFSFCFILTYITMPSSQCSEQRNGCQIPSLQMTTLQQPQTDNAITQLHQFIEKNKINDTFIAPNVIGKGQYDIQFAVQLRSVKGVQPKILNLYEKNKIDDEIIDNLEDYLHGDTTFLLEETYHLLKQAHYIVIHEQQLQTLDEAGILYQSKLILPFNEQTYVLIEMKKTALYQSVLMSKI